MEDEVDEQEKKIQALQETTPRFDHPNESPRKAILPSQIRHSQELLDSARNRELCEY